MVSENDLSALHFKGALSLNNENSLTDLKKIFLPALNAKLAFNEREDLNEFEGFNDAMILAHYLLRDTHINSERGKSFRTIETYRKELVQFISVCRDRADEIGIDYTKPIVINGEFSVLKSLQKRHIDRYVDWLQNRSDYVVKKGPYKPATLSLKITVIKSFLKQLFEWQYIHYPLHAAFKSATLTVKDRPNRDAGPEHIKFLLDLFSKNGNTVMFCLIHILTTTGIRNTELCSLKVSDVREDKINGGYYLHVVAKGNKDREIPLKDKTLQAIKLFRKVRGLNSFEEEAKIDPNAPLLTTNRGTAYRPVYLDQYFVDTISKLPPIEREEVRKQFTYYDRENPNDKNSKTIAKEMRITPHLFRHAYAIISSKSNIDVETIQRSLGHSDKKTTEIYLESVISKEQNALHKWKDTILGEYI